jgi:hypothetical protein
VPNTWYAAGGEVCLLRKSGRTVPALLTHHGLESCRDSVTPVPPGTNPCCLRYIAYARKGVTYYLLSHIKVYINFEIISPVDFRNILYSKVTLYHLRPYIYLKNLLESIFTKPQWVSSSLESFSTASTSSRQYPFQTNLSHSLTLTENISAKNDIVGPIKTTTKTPRTTPSRTKNHQDTLNDIPHHPNTNLRAPSIEMRRSCIATCQKGSR